MIKVLVFKGQRLTVLITLQKKEIFLKLPEEFDCRTKIGVTVTREDQDWEELGFVIGGMVHRTSCG